MNRAYKNKRKNETFVVTEQNMNKWKQQMNFDVSHYLGMGIHAELPSCRTFNRDAVVAVQIGRPNPFCKQSQSQMTATTDEQLTSMEHHWALNTGGPGIQMGYNMSHNVSMVMWLSGATPFGHTDIHFVMIWLKVT